MPESQEKRLEIGFMHNLWITCGYLAKSMWKISGNMVELLLIDVEKLWEIS